MRDSNHIISETILSKLRSLKLTRKSLSEATSTDKGKLDNYLQGKAKWDVEYVRKIFYVLDISFDKLLIPNKDNTYTLKHWEDDVEQFMAAEKIGNYKVNTTTADNRNSNKKSK